jgi:hypothetical protein
MILSCMQFIPRDPLTHAITASDRFAATVLLLSTTIPRGICLDLHILLLLLLRSELAIAPYFLDASAICTRILPVFSSTVPER